MASAAILDSVKSENEFITGDQAVQLVTQFKKALPEIRNVSPQQAEVYAAIQNWDMTAEKKYLQNSLGYANPENLDAMEVEYKRFMFLLATNPELSIPMSEKVDDLWHAHVLHTHNYEDACKSACGRFIHHNPTHSKEENLSLEGDYRQNTLRLYERHFGPPTPEFWLKISAYGYCCTH